ncbi:DUF3267 domain-containing protein [Oceanirhabdus sp. W0125-5]|uniref:DUF3267 domain-containing protein n=1 Tax=Oceanirhabdus sp. W0125-5 TaxID=2999116 RepID=UPI0022F33571|nr:DUF3267 domain-containing protein [Oceanirhabdus sp. W0125-5]WBW99259.1 DUF3267 domain-containing protein [Oceanirhabdus sp. W0125-5]
MDGYERVEIKPEIQLIANESIKVFLISVIIGVISNVSLNGINVKFSLYGVVIFIVLYSIGIVMHEIIHALCFRYYSRINWDNIKFGFHKQYLCPYVHCKVSVENRFMGVVLILPTIITGVFPWIFGIINGSYILIVVGALLISGGVGDFAMYNQLRRFPKASLVHDFENDIGCEVYIKK